MKTKKKTRIQLHGCPDVGLSQVILKGNTYHVYLYYIKMKHIKVYCYHDKPYNGEGIAPYL